MFNESTVRTATSFVNEDNAFATDTSPNLAPEHFVNLPRVTAIVVTFQSADTLRANVASVRRCYDARVLDCIYVDNGSHDNSPEMLRRESNWAEVVLTNRNNGFGRGCNIGLARVTNPYTLFLNPDAVIEPDAIRGMVDFLDANPKVGIVGPATYCGAVGRPSSHQVTSALPTPWSVVRAAIPLFGNAGAFRQIIPGSEPFRTGWVCGAVMMIRTELALSLGGFDPRFFLYSEEIDLCLRVAESGFETWALGTASARHIGGASSVNDGTRKSGCIAQHYYQSRRYYMIKHHGWAATTLAELSELGLICIGVFADLIRGKGLLRIRPRLQAPLFSLPSEGYLGPTALSGGPNIHQNVL